MASASTAAPKRSRSPASSSSLSPPPPPPPVDARPPSPPAGKRPPRKARKKAADDELVPARSTSSLRIGAHVSAAGGVDQACRNAAMIGATAFALFVKSQRKWTAPPLEPASVELFQAACAKFGYDPARDMLPHGSYLVNLANPDPAKRDKSFACFLDDLQRAERLGMGLYNFHPGSPMKADRAAACAFVADAINRAHKTTASIVIVLENMAGQGDVLGSRPEDLRDIIALVEDQTRVGVCIDTCHLFAASPSNDLCTPAALHATLAAFFAVVPPRFLKALHINDSKHALGAKKDRHENLGLGSIGLRGFWALLHWPGPDGAPPVDGEAGWGQQRRWDGWKDVVWVLETPSSENPAVWRREIELLRELEALDDPSRILTIEGAWKEECAQLHVQGKPKVPRTRKGQAAAAEDGDDGDGDGAEGDEAGGNDGSEEAKKGPKRAAKASGRKPPPKRGRKAPAGADDGASSDASSAAEDGDDVEPPPRPARSARAAGIGRGRGRGKGAAAAAASATDNA